MHRIRPAAIAATPRPPREWARCFDCVRLDHDRIAFTARAHSELINAYFAADDCILSSLQSATRDPQIAIDARAGTKDHVAVHGRHIPRDPAGDHERTVLHGDVAANGIAGDEYRIGRPHYGSSVPA